jgi:hypothetical protein
MKPAIIEPYKRSESKTIRGYGKLNLRIGEPALLGLNLVAI